MDIHTYFLIKFNRFIKYLLVNKKKHFIKFGMNNSRNIAHSTATKTETSFFYLPNIK